MTDKMLQPGEHHPEEYERDLNPDQLHQQSPENMTTAFEYKQVHTRLQQFTDDELRRIPVLKEGTRLEQGAVYIDLKAADIKEWTAMGGQTAGSDNIYVPKSETDYQLWNRLLKQ